MAESRLGHIVAIVSVVASAGTAIYSTWDKGQTEIELARIKASYEDLRLQREHSLKTKQERCALLTETARNLARAYGKVYQNLKTDERAEIQAHLWSAATMLSTKNKDIFLSAYQKGAEADDTYEYRYHSNLTSLVLQGLAIDGSKCISSEESDSGV